MELVEIMIGEELPIDNRHAADDELERYSQSVLSPDASARVEEHLLVCESCRGRLVEADNYLAAIKQAARALSRHELVPQRWRWPRLIPAFAALAMIAIVAITLPFARLRLAGSALPAQVAVSLAAMRGTEMQAHAPSHRPLALQLDLTGLAPSPSYRVEVVDRLGNRVWRGSVANPAPADSVIVPPQKIGMYFVRVALPSGETLREYSLEIRGTD